MNRIKKNGLFDRTQSSRVCSEATSLGVRSHSADGAGVLFAVKRRHLECVLTQLTEQEFCLQ